MSDSPLPNPHRKEVSIKLNGTTYQCRPTMDKIAKIEARFGAAMPLMQRISTGNATQAELTLIIGAMTQDVRGAPKGTRLAELIFATGVGPLVSSVTEFLAASVTSIDEMAPADDQEETDLGN